MKRPAPVPPPPMPPRFSFNDISAGEACVDELYQRVRQTKAALISADGESRALPDTLRSFLAQVAADLEACKPVSIIHNEATLTTAEAARMLGVSRQFLIKVLERGEMPYHMVGTHRRVYVRDLLAYRAARDRQRRKALDELVKAEVADGLYTIEPPDAEHR